MIKAKDTWCGGNSVANHEYTINVIKLVVHKAIGSTPTGLCVMFISISWFTLHYKYIIYQRLWKLIHNVEHLCTGIGRSKQMILSSTILSDICKKKKKKLLTSLDRDQILMTCE